MTRCCFALEAHHELHVGLNNCYCLVLCRVETLRDISQDFQEFDRAPRACIRFVDRLCLQLEDDLLRAVGQDQVPYLEPVLLSILLLYPCFFLVINKLCYLNTVVEEQYLLFRIVNLAPFFLLENGLDGSRYRRECWFGHRFDNQRSFCCSAVAACSDVSCELLLGFEEVHGILVGVCCKEEIF